jgi:hypothetical protein
MQVACNLAQCCTCQATELHKVEGEEDPPSTEHVETRRQKAMRDGQE